MANSVHRHRGNVSMAWLPMQLMIRTLKNDAGWAQIIKQFITIVAEIETKSQDEMDKGSARENYIMSKCNRWVQMIHEKFSAATVLP